MLIHGIHSLAHGAVLDAGLRWASAVFDPVLLPTRSAPPPGMPSLGPANRLLWMGLDRAMRRASRPLYDLLARAAGDRRNLPLFRARSSLLHLVACSPSIIQVPPDLPRTTVVTGAWLDRSAAPPLPAPVEDFVADGSPPIVISFGSMRGPGPEVLRDAVERVLRGGGRIIVQGDLERRVASRGLLRIGPIDHRSLIPRASVIVHHGGAGTTHAVAYAGVPSVVVPHIGDQRYWADRLHRLGAAAVPMDLATVSGPALAEAALAATDDVAMRRDAGRLSRRMANEDGLGVAVRQLEAMAG